MVRINNGLHYGLLGNYSTHESCENRPRFRCYKLIRYCEKVIIENIILSLKEMFYFQVFLVRKRGGVDNGVLYAMKVLKKASLKG